MLKRSFLSMYVIATVSNCCPNFHFSVSPHVPFLNLLFEQIANSKEYLIAKIGFDTAENEPLKVWGYGVWDMDPGIPGVNRAQ